MANRTSRLAILATVFTLVGCAHAGRGSTARVMGMEEASVATPAPAPSDETAAAAPAPPSEGAPEVVPVSAAGPVPAAADPELSALRAQAREAELAAVRAGSRVAARRAEASPGEPRSPADGARRSNAGRGFGEGMGAVAQVWVRACISHPVLMVICVAAFPVYFPFALGAMVVGGAVGAAVGAGSDAPDDSEPPPARRTARSTTRHLRRRGAPGRRWRRAGCPEGDRPPAPGGATTTCAGALAGQLKGPSPTDSRGPRRAQPPQVHSAA